MYIDMSVEIEKDANGCYDVYLSHNGSSGCKYKCVSLDGVGQCVKSYIQDLQAEFDEEEEEDED